MYGAWDLSFNKIKKGAEQSSGGNAQAAKAAILFLGYVPSIITVIFLKIYFGLLLRNLGNRLLTVN